MNDNSQIINRRWSTAEAFYAERDHRTQLEVEDFHAYVHTPVEIHISPASASSVTTQRIALLATNLTARWARNITVFVPDMSLVEVLSVQGDKLLSSRILREMREADPFGRFVVQQGPNSHPSSLRLFVGPPSPFQELNERDYVIDAAGWSAIGYRGNSILPKIEEIDAIGPAAALAASIGAGDLFKRAIGHAPTQWLCSIRWCTWHHAIHDEGCRGEHPAVPDYIDLGDLLVAGVGAVGSAFLYILGLSRCRGRITVLDRDAVETSNLNRSPLFTAVHAAAAMNKTDVAKNFLTSLGIESNAVHGTWRENGAKLGAQAFDVWVSLTNEDGAWAEVPFQLPPIVLHGTTTSGWGIALGRHIPRTEDCTACRLPRPHAEFRGPCSEGDVAPATYVEPVTASLPFLSTASAALVAVELIKLNLPNVGSLPNSVSADFATGLRSLIAVSFGPTEGCRGCEMASLPLWNERGGRGRYARLSVSQSNEQRRVA
jgi:hypothetical protein